MICGTFLRGMKLQSKIRWRWARGRDCERWGDLERPIAAYLVVALHLVRAFHGRKFGRLARWCLLFINSWGFLEPLPWHLRFPMLPVSRWCIMVPTEHSDAFLKCDLSVRKRMMRVTHIGDGTRCTGRAGLCWKGNIDPVMVRSRCRSNKSFLIVVSPNIFLD